MLFLAFDAEFLKNFNFLTENRETHPNHPKLTIFLFYTCKRDRINEWTRNIVKLTKKFKKINFHNKGLPSLDIFAKQFLQFSEVLCCGKWNFSIISVNFELIYFECKNHLSCLYRTENRYFLVVFRAFFEQSTVKD